MCMITYASLFVITCRADESSRAAEISFYKTNVFNKLMLNIDNSNNNNNIATARILTLQNHKTSTATTTYI